MENESDIPTHLLASATHLANLIDGKIGSLDLKVGELDEQIRKAEVRAHRRAEHNLRDAKCYRLGASFEPVDALDLEPTTLAGWLASGSAGVLALVQMALRNPEGGIPDLFAQLFRSQIGGDLRKLGVHARWIHRYQIYQKEVIEFKASPAFHKQVWRSKPPTANQFYLVEEISLAQQIEKPPLRTRGEAFVFIEEAGGNPAFWCEPEMPNLVAALAEFVS